MHWIFPGCGSGLRCPLGEPLRRELCLGYALVLIQLDHYESNANNQDDSSNYLYPVAQFLQHSAPPNVVTRRLNQLGSSPTNSGVPLLVNGPASLDSWVAASTRNRHTYVARATAACDPLPTFA